MEGFQRATLSNMTPFHLLFYYCLSVTATLTEPLCETNGRPGILFWDEGWLAGVMSLTLSATGIEEIYALLNPEKLVYLQKQLSGHGFFFFKQKTAYEITV